MPTPDILSLDLWIGEESGHGVGQIRPASAGAGHIRHRLGSILHDVDVGRPRLLERLGHAGTVAAVRVPAQREPAALRAGDDASCARGSGYDPAGGWGRTTARRAACGRPAVTIAPGARGLAHLAARARAGTDTGARLAGHTHRRARTAARRRGAAGASSGAAGGCRRVAGLSRGTSGDQERERCQSARECIGSQGPLLSAVRLARLPRIAFPCQPAVGEVELPPRGRSGRAEACPEPQPPGPQPGVARWSP